MQRRPERLSPRHTRRREPRQCAQNTRRKRGKSRGSGGKVRPFVENVGFSTAGGAYQKISDFADEIKVFKEKAETAPPGFFTESGEISERESNRLCYEFFTFVYETVIRGREIDWDAIIHHHGLPRQKSEILKSKIFSYFLEMLIARAKELCKDDPSAFRRAIHAIENPDNALKIRDENVEKVAAAAAKSGASRGKI